MSACNVSWSMERYKGTWIDRFWNSFGNWIGMNNEACMSLRVRTSKRDIQEGKKRYKILECYKQLMKEIQERETGSATGRHELIWKNEVAGVLGNWGVDGVNENSEHLQYV